MRFITVVLMAAIAALVAGRALPEAWSGEGVRSGVGFAFGSPDRWLAILGLGIALGTQDVRRSWTAWTSFVCGAVLGIAFPHVGFWTWITGPSTDRYLHLLGPGACLLSGLLLLTKDRWRARFLPVAVFAAVAMLVVAAALNDPALEGHAFTASASLAALGLALAASALRRLVTGTWTRVGERIGASWLLTIGLLLSAVGLLPAPTPSPMADVPRSLARVPWKPPAMRDPAPAMRPDADGIPTWLGDHGLPKGTN